MGDAIIGVPLVGFGTVAVSACDRDKGKARLIPGIDGIGLPGVDGIGGLPAKAAAAAAAGPRGGGGLGIGEASCKFILAIEDCTRLAESATVE